MAPEQRLQPTLDERLPSGRLSGLWFDTASYHPSALHAAIAAVGVDRVVFGSDHPPAGDSPAAAVETVEKLDISADERDRILSGNARRLLDRSTAPTAT